MSDLGQTPYVNFAVAASRYGRAFIKPRSTPLDLTLGLAAFLLIAAAAWWSMDAGWADPGGFLGQYAVLFLWVSMGRWVVVQRLLLASV